MGILMVAKTKLLLQDIVKLEVLYGNSYGKVSNCKNNADVVRT